MLPLQATQVHERLSWRGSVYSHHCYAESKFVWTWALAQANLSVRSFADLYEYTAMTKLVGPLQHITSHLPFLEHRYFQTLKVTAAYMLNSDSSIASHLVSCEWCDMFPLRVCGTVCSGWADFCLMSLCVWFLYIYRYILWRYVWYSSVLCLNTFTLVLHL